MAVITDRVALKTGPGIEQTITEVTDYANKPVNIHAYGHERGICGIIVSYVDYPSGVAHHILSEICNDFLVKHQSSAYTNLTRQAVGTTPPFSLPKLKDTLKDDYGNATTSYSKIQVQLADTEKVIIKTIHELLGRGEKLDELVHKSAQLSQQSKLFYLQVGSFQAYRYVETSLVTVNCTVKKAKFVLRSHVGWRSVCDGYD
jgi:synaptobrevin family protein YKT6